METENSSVPLPGPLRAFDGVLAVGLSGGGVLLLDLCWQILDEGTFSVSSYFYSKQVNFKFSVSIGNADVKDELNPCDVVVLFNKDMSRIEYYKEKSVRKGYHLAIHVNSTFFPKLN